MEFVSKSSRSSRPQELKTVILNRPDKTIVWYGKDDFDLISSSTKYGFDALRYIPGANIMSILNARVLILSFCDLTAETLSAYCIAVEYGIPVVWINHFIPQDYFWGLSLCVVDNIGELKFWRQLCIM